MVKDKTKKNTLHMTIINNYNYFNNWKYISGCKFIKENNKIKKKELNKTW